MDLRSQTSVTFDDRVELRRVQFIEEIVAQGWWISPDERIGERDAGRLLGFTHQDSMRNARRRNAGGCWPKVYRIGGNNNKLTYTVRDLAEYVERRAEIPVDAASIFSEVNRSGSRSLSNLNKLA